jgi:predicted cupin superfamily sugar epimerase
MITAQDIIEKLALSPLPMEGGYYAETYRSQLNHAALPEPYRGSRAFGTAIYYLLTRESYSAIHRLPGDEIFHFYLGDPVEMLQLQPDGSVEVTTLGSDILRGMRLQTVVAGGVWQGSQLAAGGSFALLGTTMAPGFDFSDYVAGDAAQLCAAYPQHAERIRGLIRPKGLSGR